MYKRIYIVLNSKEKLKITRIKWGNHEITNEMRSKIIQFDRALKMHYAISGVPLRSTPALRKHQTNSNEDKLRRKLNYKLNYKFELRIKTVPWLITKLK